MTTLRMVGREEKIRGSLFLEGLLFGRNNLDIYVELILRKMSNSRLITSGRIRFSDPARGSLLSDERRNERDKEGGKREKEGGEGSLADTSESRSVPRRFKGRDISFRRAGVQLPNECIPFSLSPKREGIFRTAQFSVSRRAATCIHFLASKRSK